MPSRPLPANLGEGLAGKTSVRIHHRSVHIGHIGRSAGARRQVNSGEH